MIIFDALQYTFVQKAILVGSLMAICCSCLGIFLVLKKQSMIGDGLAHVSFAAIAIALFVSSSPLLLSIPIVILASFFILMLNERAGIYGDAAIGLVASFSIAIGVMISSLSNGFNIDLFSYLFGSILVISDVDVVLSLILSSIVILTMLLSYNHLFAITYDESFAKVIGIKVKFMNYLLAALTSVTIVLGIRVVGTMLISSMVIFPTVSALQLSRGFKSTILISILISLFCVISGIVLSFILNTPTGATIVIMNGVCFGLSFLTHLTH